MIDSLHRYRAVQFVGWVCLGLLSWVGNAAEPLRVQIFTTDAQPVQVGDAASDPTLQLQIVHVDALDRLNDTLSTHLPVTPTDAQAQVRARLGTLESSQIDGVRQAATGLADAFQLGVDRIPAIVFDRKAVIYGVTILPAALSRYRVWTGDSH